MKKNYNDYCVSKGLYKIVTMAHGNISQTENIIISIILVIYLYCK